MIVHDFDFGGVAVRPDKAEAILIVDPNAVLPFPVTLERLQMVTRKSPQILQHFSLIQCGELPLSRPFDDVVLPGELVVEKLPRFGVAK